MHPESSVDEIKSQMLEEVEEKGPPDKIEPYLNTEDWKEFSRIIAEDVIQEDKDRWVLDQAEIAGLQLLLSPDQKRLRPSIGMKFYDWIGSEKSRDAALQAFAMPEVTHIYTKGIDDIMDRDDWRNEFPTIQRYMQEVLDVAEGDELAENVAIDYWLDVKSRNYSLISNLDEDEFPLEEQKKLRMAVEEAESHLSNGQTLDITGVKIGDEGFHVQPEYLGGDEDMVKYTGQTNRGKTSAIFGVIGTFAEQITDYNGDALTQWGLKAGEAFQIADDVLDLENERWKDLENGNYTLPIALGEEYLHTSGQEELKRRGERFTEIFRADKNNEKELEEAYEILSETPAVEKSIEMARDLAEEAISYLNEVEEEISNEPEDEESREFYEIKEFTRMMSYKRGK